MTDFPSLSPQSRSYTPGSFAVRRSKTLSGKEVTVRRTNAAVDYRLRFTFTSGSIAQQGQIFSHYAVHNRFQPFDLPSSVLQDSGLTFPAGYQWIYAKTPTVVYDPGVVRVSVELLLVAPYDI
tara:strand:+ start:2577 stop:2945 length:369 start_codon:yes stop_codon:yes gene_type:complete